ncbi:MAG: ComEC family competence protein [Candidatus Yonathbacteria bacterium]|nr:ComEC family competence protein [Candidatus Yonathbacteria bacterium]
MRAQWFLILVAGFTSGVALRSFFNLGSAFTLFLIFAGAVFFLFFTIKKDTKVFLVSLTLFSIGLGMFRYDLSDAWRGDPVLNSQIEKTISIRGIISDEPDLRSDHTNLTIDVTEIDIAQEKHSIKTRALVITDRYPSWNYGDEVFITGKLLLPKNFENGDTGRSFDYVSYLAKDGIFYQFIRPNISRAGEGKGNVVKQKLLLLKHAFLDRVSRVISEPESSLLGGLLVGAKQSLGKDLLDDFRTAGVIHIVVLSGYNLTIVAEAMMRFFSFAPRMIGLTLGGTSIVLFSIMTGAGATVVRASLMALLALLARATGRIYEITLALLFAGFVMLLYNPKILIFDPSFQLSFLATLGLINLSPLLEKHLKFLPKTFGLRDIVSATLATQIFVLPLLLYMMGKFSIVSLPVNLLILPFIPLTMLFGFLAGAAGFISTILSFPFALIAHLFLWYELKVVEVAAAIPFASIGGFALSGPVMFFVYAGAIILIYIFNRKKDVKQKI